MICSRILSHSNDALDSNCFHYQINLSWNFPSFICLYSHLTLLTVPEFPFLFLSAPHLVPKLSRMNRFGHSSFYSSYYLTLSWPPPASPSYSFIIEPFSALHIVFVWWPRVHVDHLVRLHQCFSEPLIAKNLQRRPYAHWPYTQLC